MGSPPLLLKTAHISMQRNDSDAQQKADTARIFRRARSNGLLWVTGTEAGPAAGRLADHLRRSADAKDYRFVAPRMGSDVWLAVDRRAIAGRFVTGYIPVIPGRLGKWAPRGLRWASFNAGPSVGTVSVSVAHYVTGGQINRHLNREIAEKTGEWARRHGKGSSLAFYSGDQNIGDGVADTFFGQPLTSAWDELGKHENTGAGNIDVIASYNNDTRVRARYIRALDDSEFFLHTDHFWVEAGFSVERLRP